MRIYLLRHGTAEPHPPEGPPDPERALVEKGRQQSRRAAMVLDASGARFDRVLTSPLVRAVQTAEEVVDALDLGVEIEECTALSPEMSPRTAIEALLARGASCLLAVGHEPLLSGIAASLIGDAAARITLRKGGIIELRLVELSPPRAELLGLIRPGHRFSS